MKLTAKERAAAVIGGLYGAIVAIKALWKRRNHEKGKN